MLSVALIVLASVFTGVATVSVVLVKMVLSLESADCK